MLLLFRYLLIFSLNVIAIKAFSEPSAVWNSSICPQEPMTTTDLLSYMGTTKSYKLVGSHKFYLRYRQCSTSIGCTDWKNADPIFSEGNGIESSLKIYSENSEIFAKHFNKKFVTNNFFYTSQDFYVKSETTSLLSFKANLVSGDIYKTCTWMRFAGVSKTQDSGNYFENELIYYGTH